MGRVPQHCFRSTSNMILNFTQLSVEVALCLLWCFETLFKLVKNSNINYIKPPLNRWPCSIAVTFHSPKTVLPSFSLEHVPVGQYSMAINVPFGMAGFCTFSKLWSHKGHMFPELRVYQHDLCNKKKWRKQKNQKIKKRSKTRKRKAKKTFRIACAEKCEQNNDDQKVYTV